MKKLTPKSLKSILEKGETQKIEFKESVSSNLDKEIVAFANSQGGKIYIGITDKGEIKGVNITNKIKSQIESIAKNCDPEVPVSIEELKKEKVLIIQVKESKNKPHRCSTGFYRRSHSTSQKLNTEEIYDFMEDEELIRFDVVTCKKFDYKKHFDKQKLFSFLDRSKVSYKKDEKSILSLLENLEVAKKKGSKVIFNNAGALLFSKDLEKLYFHTEISCGLFKGVEKVHVIDSDRFNKDLPSSVESAMQFLWKNLRARHELIHKTARRRDVLEIPPEALREALVNAVTHRNYTNQGPFVTVEIYDDRVEISNFGGLPKGLKRKDFGKKSVPRNLLLANLMWRANYIEKMGTGIKKMKDLVKEEGLSPIKFEFGNFTTVTFYRKPLYENVGVNVGVNVGENFGVKERRAYKLLKILRFIEEGRFSAPSFAKQEKTTSRTVERHIELLKEKGFIVFEGSARAGKYKVTDKYKKLKKKLYRKRS